MKMAATSMGFREVGYTANTARSWREISVTVGSSHSEDLKLQDIAGGFGYSGSGRLQSAVRNRFIQWRTSACTLELVEESLDQDLHGSHVRFHFPHQSILPGLSIHEAHREVVILVITVSTVHRLIFPHPSRLEKNVSIFADASVATVRHPSNSHSIHSTSTPQFSVHTATSWLTMEGEALFAVATHTGSILLIKLPSHDIQGIVTQHELKQSSVMQRLWTGLVPAMIRGGQESTDMATSLCIHPVNNDYVIFAVCRDHKLRVWSCKRLECLISWDLLNYIPDSVDPTRTFAGVQSHMIKKSSLSKEGVVTLGVYLTFGDSSQFLVLQPAFVDGQYHLSHVSTMFGRSDTLVDFCLTPAHLWTLWSGTESEPIVQYASLGGESVSTNIWADVFLESSLPSEIVISDFMDPREAYTLRIFHPGQFSLQAIAKALNIYHRSAKVSTDVPIESLKEQVTTAVENEIHSQASEYEVSEDEYYQLQLQQWSKFYSCCVQYQEVGSKPLGLFSDVATGMVCVVKKTTLSYIRPCDILEFFQLSPQYQITFDDFPSKYIQDRSLWSQVITLVHCTKLVKRLLTADLEYEFEHSLFHGEPVNVAQQVVDAILRDQGERNVHETMNELQTLVRNLTDIEKAVTVLLELADLAQGNPEGLQTSDLTIEVSRQMLVSHLFSSDSAVGIISSGLCQMVESRFAFTRDLLILQVLLTQMGNQVGVDLRTSQKIASDLIPTTKPLVLSYFLLKWTCQTSSSPIPPDSVESNMRQMDALDITDSGPSVTGQLTESSPMSLAQLFLCGAGGEHARILLAHERFLDDDPCSLWTSALKPALVVLGQLLWPVSVNFLFPEFLMSKCQYLPLQCYIRLLRGWCEWNVSSRQFLLGQSYLNFNEPDKALSCFLSAVHGVRNEEFLINKLLQAEDTSLQKLEVLYYLKVIRLFGDFQLPLQVISLATTAISCAELDDENIPTLWSIIFKHQLELGHNDEAYAAMIANPDPTRQKDCLRQLVVVLCDRKQLQTLVEFPYTDLHDEVVGIIECRARSVDLATHNYYDLLYAFHIQRGNFRKAGSVMYEHGMRLACELPGLAGLQRQAKCYLVALNTLRLVSPDYAWIVRPVPKTLRQLGDAELSGVSPKRMLDGEKKILESQKLDVIELKDIEKEYMLVHARLKLLQKDPDMALAMAPMLSESETVGLLVNSGLYDHAVTVCETFNMPLTRVIDGLTLSCVQLAQGSSYHMKGDNDCTAAAWDWLVENEIGSRHLNKDLSATDQAWRLLQTYLERHEKSSSCYHRCAAEKMLLHDFSFPNWFTASYKRINAPELLRLYIDYDLLEEATLFAIEYVEAATGKGADYFGIKGTIQFSGPCSWLPYTMLDQLLLSLRQVNTNAALSLSHQDLCRTLESKLSDYHQAIKTASQDKISASLRAQRKDQMVY